MLVCGLVAPGSNTSLQKAMASSILRILRLNPTATSISVTGMDGSPSECPPDGIANKEENTTGGANFRAIQSISAIVNQEFPHVKLQSKDTSNLPLLVICGSSLTDCL